MNTFLTLIIVSLLSLATAFAQNDNDANAKAEKQINVVYQKILKEYSQDKEFIKNLKAAQRLWIQFRDAEIVAKYPNRPIGYYGSAHAMCVSNLRAQLTNDRIKTLSVWLVGIQEGDVCSGSVKKKN